MSDFLAWLSPTAIPKRIKDRWNFGSAPQLGTRPDGFAEVGIAEAGEQRVVLVGWGWSRRRGAAPSSLDAVAKDLLEDLRNQGKSALDLWLGPMAGVWMDGQTGQTALWRDRFGRVPLQKIRLGPGWAVTTCPTTVAALSNRRPRRDHLAQFLLGTSVRDDGDAFDDVWRIRPAEYLCFEGHELVDRSRWWRADPRPSVEPAEQLSRHLDRLAETYSAKPHILALSAGLDSSSLAALVTSRRRDSEAVTFVDPLSRRNEGPLAARVAEDLGLPWRGFGIAEHWPLSRREDHHFPSAWGPCGHPDFAWKRPFHRWLDQRRPDVAILYGNGADDVLWVPPQLWLTGRFHHGDWEAVLEAFRHQSLSRWIRPGLSYAVDRAGLRRWRELLPSWPDPSPLWQQPGRWVGARARDETIPPLPAAARFRALRRWRLDTWRWERAMRSLAAEARQSNRQIWTPFLDAPFWELSLSLSPGQLIEGGRQKSLLRRAVGNRLPRQCRQRKKIGGFDPLVERGLANRASAQIYALFARPRLGESIAFDTERFLDAYEAYRRGPATNATYRGSWMIWKTVAAELWLAHNWLPGFPQTDTGVGP